MVVYEYHCPIRNASSAVFENTVMREKNAIFLVDFLVVISYNRCVL